jgi:TolB-like protein
MHRAAVFLGTLLAGSVACAQRMHSPELTPSGLDSLDAARARVSHDPDALTTIGIAFYEARAYARARDVFLAVLTLEPRSFTAAVELGLSQEALGDLDAALASYQRADALKVSKADRRLVEARLLALTQVRFAAEARHAIAAEAALAATPPMPNSLAVLPWAYLGRNPELKPLERGLAQLVVSDLAKVPRFTLLERERAQALESELALSVTGRVDVATAARAGRLLRAADVLQGSFRETGGGSIRLDANVVSAATGEVRATGSATDQLSDVFAAEKAVVLDLLGRLGIALSPAEQRAITERPTADLQAFLAFSRGLEAEDQGHFEEAAVLYQQAATRDPAFAAARARAERSGRTGAASHMTPARLALAIQGLRQAGPSNRSLALATATQGIAPTLAGRLTQRPSRLIAIRARFAEAARQDDPSRLSTIGKVLQIIPRP